MTEIISNNSADITPNTGKSNLSIKNRRKHHTQKDIEKINRKQHDIDVVKNSNIIFGFDNGATRNSFMHSSIS